MFALPAQAGRLRQRFLHYRRGVDKNFDVAADLVDEPASEMLQPRLDHLVVIIALGVDRDGAARARSCRIASGSSPGP